MKRRNYSGYEILDRDALLDQLANVGVTPRHEQVVCEHVTHHYPDAERAPEVTSIRIVGHAADDGVQALLVEIDGSSTRPDGKLYHVTLSVAEGHKPVESNDLLASAVVQDAIEVLEPLAVSYRPF